MTEQVIYSKENRELEPTNPTFFVCSGTSGAGLSTAIQDIVRLGLVEKPPTQYVTRQLRPNEVRCDQYYPVTDEILSKIPGLIMLEAVLYGNRYGFFKPAVDRLKRTLQSKNVIIDSVNSADEWKGLLPNQRITSIFFAPTDPRISLQRIIDRARNANAKLDQRDVQSRVNDSRENVMQIDGYDYWIDTTNFDSILPALTSVVLHESQNANHEVTAIRIKDNPELIQQLQINYDVDLTKVVNSYFE